MSSVERRIQRLEEQQGRSTDTPFAVVRYTPAAGDTDWLRTMTDRLGWSHTVKTLVVIQGDAGACDPVVIVPPRPHSELTSEGQAASAAAGREPGNWFVGIIGSGAWTPTPMRDGALALIAELRRSIRQQDRPWEIAS